MRYPDSMQGVTIIFPKPFAEGILKPPPALSPRASFNARASDINPGDVLRNDRGGHSTAFF